MKDIDWEEVKTLKKLAMKYKWCGDDVRNFLEKDKGVSIRQSDFYSSSPSIEDINNSFEYDEHGNSLPIFSPEKYSEASQLQHLLRLNKTIDESSLDDFCSSTGFQWGNGQFDRSDALHYWAFIQELKPKKILEIGSGWSSRIAACAAKSTNSNVTCIDPCPRADLENLDVDFERSMIQAFKPETLASSISAEDILFIDSSHSVKTGNDVVYIYCLLFPLLPNGLTVHIHDVYLPYGRPKKQLVTNRLYWYEDYFTQILVSNGYLKPLISNNFLSQTISTKKHLIQTPNGKGGASMWFQVCKP